MFGLCTIIYKLNKCIVPLGLDSSCTLSEDTFSCSASISFINSSSHTLNIVHIQCMYIYLFSEIVSVQFVLSLHYFVSLLTATFVSTLTLLNIYNYTLLLLINLPSVDDTSIIDCLLSLSLVHNKSIIKHITHSLLLIYLSFLTIISHFLQLTTIFSQDVLLLLQIFPQDTLIPV